MSRKRANPATNPILIARHCSLCSYQAVTVPRPDRPTVEIDGVTWELTEAHPDCPLHGTNPTHDLPDGI